MALEGIKKTYWAARLPKQWRLALSDLAKGIKSWRIWGNLGLQDIRLRYRRSYLGPIWITISMSVMVYSMGLFYSQLLKVHLADYFPYIASGILIWTLISSLILELTDSFIEAENLIKQIKLPYSVYPLRVVSRNFLVFLHNVIAIVPLLIYFRVSICFFSFLFGLIVLACYGLVYGLIFALIGARFRDIKPIIASILQVSFFITPVMWMPEMIPDRFSFVFYLNPFYQIIELVRGPLIGTMPSLYNIMFNFILLVLGFLQAFLLLIKARCRIAFWV